MLRTAIETGGVLQTGGATAGLSFLPASPSCPNAPSLRRAFTVGSGQWQGSQPLYSPKRAVGFDKPVGWGVCQKQKLTQVAIWAEWGSPTAGKEESVYGGSGSWLLHGQDAGIEPCFGQRAPRLFGVGPLPVGAHLNH